MLVSGKYYLWRLSINLEFLGDVLNYNIKIILLSYKIFLWVLKGFVKWILKDMWKCIRLGYYSQTLIKTFILVLGNI